MEDITGNFISEGILMAIDIKRVQSKLLDMALIIANILDKHNIPYEISYGTLLGAARHGGFIPWDDDFDFNVFNEYYDEAIKYLREELPKDLFVEDETSEPRYFHSWAHVKDIYSRTSCDHYWQDGVYAHQGISVDLYRIERVKLKNVIVRVEEEILKYISRRKELGLMDEAEIEARKARLKTIVSDFYRNNLDSVDEESINRDVYATVYTNWTYHEIDNIFPLRKYKFEDAEFWGPNNYDEVLKRQYGDYMALPPEEARVPHYSDVEFFDKE